MFIRVCTSPLDNHFYQKKKKKKKKYTLKYKIKIHVHSLFFYGKITNVDIYIFKCISCFKMMSYLVIHLYQISVWLLTS